jgi:hypothetical protein
MRAQSLKAVRARRASRGLRLGALALGAVVLVGAPRGDSVWLFGLEGTLPPAAERDPEIRTTAAPAPPRNSSSNGTS